jgi:hypothetical protein
VLFSYLLLAQHAQLKKVTPEMQTAVTVLQKVIARGMARREVPQMEVELAAAMVLGVVLEVAVFKAYNRITQTLAVGSGWPLLAVLAGIHWPQALLISAPVEYIILYPKRMNMSREELKQKLRRSPEGKISCAAHAPGRGTGHLPPDMGKLLNELKIKNQAVPNGFFLACPIFSVRSFPPPGTVPGRLIPEDLPL